MNDDQGQARRQSGDEVSGDGEFVLGGGRLGVGELVARAPRRVVDAAGAYAGKVPRERRLGHVDASGSEGDAELLLRPYTTVGKEAADEGPSLADVVAHDCPSARRSRPFS